MRSGLFISRRRGASPSAKCSKGFQRGQPNNRAWPCSLGAGHIYHSSEGVSLKPFDIAHAARYTHDALQKHEELAAFLAIVADIEPLKVIVEVGAYAGGTLWAWQQLGDVRVIGVDLPPPGRPTGPTVNDEGMTVILGDSHDPATMEQLVTELAGEPVDMLFIDGDHTYEGVKADFELYAPLVRPGGIIGLHDICHHPGMPFIEVDRYWLTLHGDKEEIILPPYTWGGIGVIHAEPPEKVADNRARLLGRYREAQDGIYHRPNKDHTSTSEKSEQ